MLTFLGEDFTLTKRHLGLILLALGIVSLIGVLSVDPLAELMHRLGRDVLAPDRQGGIGPVQLLVMGLSALITLLGLSLIPLGGTPVIGKVERAKPAALPHPWGRVMRTLLWVVLAALLFYLVIYVVYAVHIIQFPFDYDQGEGFELVDTIMFSQFRWPYQNTEVYPFYSSNYPPLFHIVAAPFVWLFGGAYWYGRLLVFLGTLITAAAIGYAVYREEPDYLIAAISGLTFLASNYIYHIGPLFRQHLFMVMFEILAVVVLAHVPALADSRQQRRRLAIGIALLLAAGYTKQHAVFTCLAAFAYLFLWNPRRALIWGALFALIGGVIFLWIDRSTGGQWWLNAITANFNPFIPGQFLGLLRQWFGLHGILILMAGLLVLYEFYLGHISLYSIWFIAALLSTVLAGKWGAGDSYFATTIAAACILSGIFAARTVRGAWRWPGDHPPRLFRPVAIWLAARRAAALGLAAVMIPALYLLYAAAVFHMPTEGTVLGPLSRALGVTPNTSFAFYDSAGWTTGYAVLGHLPTGDDIAAGQALVAIVAEGDTPALSEDAGFSLLAGKDVIGNPTQLLNLYKNRVYDPTALTDLIEEQAFHALILRALFYPDPILHAMDAAYDPEQAIALNGFYYQVLRPDPTWPGRRALRDAIWTLQPGQSVEGVVLPPVEGIEDWLDAEFIRTGWSAENWADSRNRYERENERATAWVEEMPGAGEEVRVRLEAAPAAPAD